MHGIFEHEPGCMYFKYERYPSYRVKLGGIWRFIQRLEGRQVIMFYGIDFEFGIRPDIGCSFSTRDGSYIMYELGDFEFYIRLYNYAFRRYNGFRAGSIEQYVVGLDVAY